MYGGFDPGAVKLLKRLKGMAAQDHRDSTDYSLSNTRSFKAYWTRRIAVAIMMAVGDHLLHQSHKLSKGTLATNRRGAAGRRETTEGGRRPGQATFGDYVRPNYNNNGRAAMPGGAARDDVANMYNTPGGAAWDDVHNMYNVGTGNGMMGDGE